jgi:hypothetical protein
MKFHIVYNIFGYGTNIETNNNREQELSIKCEEIYNNFDKNFKNYLNAELDNIRASR